MHIDERYRRICSVIEDCIIHEKKQFYIYPFGVVGGQVKSILNDRYGIFEAGIIDNKLAYLNEKIIRISDLKEHDMNEDSVILISSEAGSIMQTLVKSLPSFVRPTQVSFALNDVWEKSVTDNMGFDLIYKHCKVGRRTSGYKSLMNPFPLAESIGRYCNINYSAKTVPNHSLDLVSIDVNLLEENFGDTEDDYRKKSIYMKKYGKYKENCWEQFDKYTRNNPPINIGNDVWIAQNVVILPGVTIQDGAVCAAGAVVSSDVPPYTIVGGVPAIPIKKRYSEEIIDGLLKIRWWNWSEEKIKDNLEYFYQPEIFVKTFS